MARRIDISKFLPIWRTSEDLLGRSESLLIFGPRFSGKSTLLRALMRDMAPKLGRRAVVLELASAAHGDEIDYTFLFQMFLSNGGFVEKVPRRRSKIRDREEFVRSIDGVIDDNRDGIIIGVRLADQGIEAEQYDLLKSLHVLLGREYFDNKKRELSVVV